MPDWDYCLITLDWPSLPWRSPRKLLFLCAGLDLGSIFASLALINLHYEPDLLHPWPLVLAVACIYCLFSWLLGAYTVLRWPWLRLRLVLQRLGLTALASIVAVILLSWILAIDPLGYSLLNRSVLLELFGLQTVFALFGRLGLRALTRSRPVWQLMAAPAHQRDVLREWQRNPFVRPPRLLSPDASIASALEGKKSVRPMALALAHGLDLDEIQRDQILTLRSRGVLVTSLEEMAERQLERLPPTLLPQAWLTHADLPWSNEFSLQRKLKRMADLLIAGLLLLLSIPIVLVAALAIWLEDRGPVFYVQQRTGLMNKPFVLFKLRTMRSSVHGAPTPWTVKADARVTRIGAMLRRTRLDELPQLVNVLRGEMSLIGPRPEQPHLDENLSRQIPHYLKRYWMLPGLSGWAQVCGPSYPSSIEESELKLSYDLYYLRHWNLSLDLLILAKTLKTLLKVRGR